MWLSALGWAATAFFASSYFFKKAAALRTIQACAAVLWIVYGFAIHSAPVVVANLIVALAAVYTSWQLKRSREQAKGGMGTNAGEASGATP
jgi:Bacterial inner membrane protein